VDDVERLLTDTARHAAAYLASLETRPVDMEATVEELRRALGGPLPEGPLDDERVVSELVEAAGPGVVASAGGRYFGFVVGGTLPVALAADWLTSTWDQNSGLYVLGGSSSVVEEVTGAWLKELLALPADASVAYVTGCQMAHVTALAAARHRVLERAGWDLARDGLQGSPRIRVLVGEQRHITIDRALRLLGLGASQLEALAVDGEGRLRADAVRDALAAGEGPTIVCAQAGDVNTGNVDPLVEIADAVEGTGAWLHVDGAFGLWAAASPRHRHLVEGVERADSWATDAHKWLNVPYDSGIAFCADADAHRAAMSVRASYLVHSDDGGPRDPVDWTPEFSRRARAFPVYAALRALGRGGVADLVERCCAHARRFAELLGAEEGVEILNEVVLNQVLVRFGDDDETTREVVRRVQEDGTCWLGGSEWQGRAVMRISVSNWRTTTEDVERSAAAILAAAAAVSGALR
jgi:glutamate/tyrosine decarboxylase-like PLP-dependent enzyme